VRKERGGRGLGAVQLRLTFNHVGEPKPSMGGESGDYNMILWGEERVAAIEAAL